MKVTLIPCGGMKVAFMRLSGRVGGLVRGDPRGRCGRRCGRGAWCRCDWVKAEFLSSDVVKVVSTCLVHLLGAGMRNSRV